MANEKEAPLIIGFVADLMFTTKIENVARHLGFKVQWIEDTKILGEQGPDTIHQQPGEAIHGSAGRLFTKLADWQPALLLFDLANENIPWQRWIATIKSSPATRRMPIICFGPHVNVEMMTEAKRLGADAVLARSRFTVDMGNLLQQYARLPDYDSLQLACQQPLSEKAIRGIELHNNGKYFEAHEELEDAWNEDQGPGRDLYQGILQVSVAYLQIQRSNYRGAVKMCLRVRQWLDHLSEICRGVNVDQLRQDIQTVHSTLLELGPERFKEIDPALLKPIQYKLNID